MEGSKVISVGGRGGGLVVGAIRDIKVKRDWGDHRSLGDTKVDFVGAEERVIIGAFSCVTLDVRV